MCQTLLNGSFIGPENKILKNQYKNLKPFK